MSTVTFSRTRPGTTLEKPLWRVLGGCRICGSTELLPLLDLGEQAIANAFHHPGEKDPQKAPLELLRCAGCSLVQLGHSVDTDRMYATYWYRSGTNRTMRDHLRGLVEEAEKVADVRNGDLVIDVGCNDGTTLSCWSPGVTTIGVDPSNISPKRADAFVNDYFTWNNVAPALGERRAKVLTSIAMFYDLDEPRAFARDVAACLANDGIWVLELSYLPSMLEKVSYDTICHEHVTYYRIETFERVLEDTGLQLFDVAFNECNGGSFRLFVARAGTRAPTPRLVAAHAEELRGAFDGDAPYQRFQAQVEASRTALRAFFARARTEGKQVWGYGASTKGMVTLQFCGIGKDDVVAIAERNPDKFGLLTPGTDIPITSESTMRQARPDYLLVLPWHFLPEFLEREQAYLNAGGKIVVPLPEFRILTGAKGT